MVDAPVLDWGFSLKTAIVRVVENKFHDERHRWPLMLGFDIQAFDWNKTYIIIILYDKVIQVPTANPNIQKLPFELPFVKPTLENIESLHNEIRNKFPLKEKDAVLIVPVIDGNSHKERIQKLDDYNKKLWSLQISINIERHYYYLKGFDISAGFFLPPGYTHLSFQCEEFFYDNPNYSKNIFIMMKFDKTNNYLKETEKELRNILTRNGYNPLRADNKMYMKDRDMWNNVCVYMLCCKQGIAILENYSKQEYNPNVGIEYGFMRALDKRVLLLTDEEFPSERADIVGKEKLFLI